MQRGKKKKKPRHLSIPSPWEFETPVSFLRAPDPSLLLGDPGRLISLPRNWLSEHHAMHLFCPVWLLVVLLLRPFLKDARWADSSVLPAPAVFSISCYAPRGSLCCSAVLLHVLQFSVNLACVIRARDSCTLDREERCRVVTQICL